MDDMDNPRMTLTCEVNIISRARPEWILSIEVNIISRGRNRARARARILFFSVSRTGID